MQIIVPLIKGSLIISADGIRKSGRIVEIDDWDSFVVELADFIDYFSKIAEGLKVEDNYIYLISDDLTVLMEDRGLSIIVSIYNSDYFVRFYITYYKTGRGFLNVYYGRDAIKVVDNKLISTSSALKLFSVYDRVYRLATA